MPVTVRHFLYIYPFNSHNILRGGSIMLIYKWRIWGPGRLNNLPKVAQPVNGQAWIQTQAVLF